MSKYDEILRRFSQPGNPEKEAEALAEILGKQAPANETDTVYKTILGCIDLTSLQAADHTGTIRELAQHVNEQENRYPELPSVAALCVYPNFVEPARMFLEVSEVRIAAVAGAFPFGQTFPEIKVAETALAVKDGADEIDTVIGLGRLRERAIEEAGEELEEIKNACQQARLKVILESGALQTREAIREAAFIAMQAGADFVKTSTGKIAPAATPEAAYAICGAIREYADATGRKVGFKAAGGIVTPQEAVAYYTIVKAVLGEAWLTPDLFRIGASRLANNLLSAITGETVKLY